MSTGILSRDCVEVAGILCDWVLDGVGFVEVKDFMWLLSLLK